MRIKIRCKDGVDQVYLCNSQNIERIKENNEVIEVKNATPNQSR